MKKNFWVLALVLVFAWATAGLAATPAEKAHVDELIQAYESGQDITSAEKTMLLNAGYDIGGSVGVDYVGGPDAFGYSFRDSDEEGGPVYEWVDISETGTAIDGTGDDGGAGPFELGQAFNFYGQAVTQFWVNSNGFINFSSLLSGYYSNSAIPSTGNPNNAVYLFWDDLHERNGTIYYLYDAENGVTRIQYDNWGSFSGTDQYMDAQVALFEDGRIILYYETFTESWGLTSETIGIENADGTIALQASYNTTPDAYPYSGLAIEFYLPEADASITGTITDADSGDPIEGATVMIAGGTAMTDANGDYEIAECYSGTWDLTVTADFYLDYFEAGVVIDPGANVVDAALTIAPPEPYAQEIEYFWYDITDDGVDLAQGDDTWIYIDFAEAGWGNFTWYGIEYTGIYVCSNGWLAFIYDESGTIYTNELPSVSDPNASFYLCADDLNAATAGIVWAGFENDCFVVTYDGVAFYGDASHTVTMQAVFTPDGTVFYNYDTIAYTDYSGTHSIGFEDETGERGESIYYGSAFDYPANESSFRIGLPGGTLEGTVTEDGTGIALEDFVVEVWTPGMEELLYATLTDANGDYIFDNVSPGMYDVKAYGLGHRSQVVTDVEIVIMETTVVDFELEVGTDPVNLTGWVMSADTPDTYVPGVVVQIPALGIFDVTETDGSYDLGEITEGTYNFVVTHIPDGTMGYHGVVTPGIEVNPGTVPMTLYMPEILPPMDLVAQGFDEEVLLNWDAPANHGGGLAMLETSIEVRSNMIAELNADGSPEALAKIPALEAELYMLQNEYALQNGGELDNIEDFVGYRLAMIVDGNWTILPDVIGGESYTMTGLTNGILYGFAVAADYEYGDNYLEWTEVVEVRPLPTGGEYEVAEIDFEWVDISEIGTAVDGTGDDGGAGPFAIGFDFPFYGSTYNQFWMNSNGHINFLTLLSGYYSNTAIPNTAAPNAAVYLFWDDLHERNGTFYYYNDEENGLTRLQYANWGHLGAADTETMNAQAVLYDNGRIEFYYDSFTAAWPMTSETIGIENSTGTEALMVSYNDSPTGYPYNELALRLEQRERTFGLLEGYVTDYATEEGVPGVMVDIVDTEGIHWYGETDEFGYYGALVDRSTGPYDVTFSRMGYVDVVEEGVEFETDPEIFETQLDAVMEPFGSIWGIVTYGDTEEFAEGAVVQILDEDDEVVAATTVDAEGWYGFMQMFEDRTATYYVHSYINGYMEYDSDGLTWDVPGDQFLIEHTFEIDPIDPSTPPQIVSWMGDYDDGVDVVLREPGSYAEEVFIQYDDGTVVNAHSFFGTDNDANGWFGFRFFMDGASLVSGGEMRLTVDTDPWGAWPNGVNEPILLLLFDFDLGTNMPGEEPMFTSGEVTASVAEPFVYFSPYMGVADDFCIGMVHTVYGDDREGICVDGAVATPNVYMHTTAQGGWFSTTFSGDVLTRAWVMVMGAATATDVEDINAEEVTVLPRGVQIANANLESPIWGVNPTRPAGRSGYRGHVNELDEFLGYNVYISTDNTTFEQSNEELIEDNMYFAFYGSEWEDQDVYLYATAMVDIEGDIIESDPCETETVVFNMAPAAPTDLGGEVDDENMTADLDWSAPTENADGSDLVDLDGYNIYRGGELVGTVDNATTTYQDEVEIAGYYTYYVTAFDEVPNESAGSISVTLQIGEAPYESGFDEGDAMDFTTDGAVWEHGVPTAGPGAAYSEPNVWATVLGGNYNNNDDAYLTSTERNFPILDASAVFIYMHWLSYENSWDGYNVQVSTDGGATWQIIDPVGGYNDDAVVGLDNTRGFTAATNGWQMVMFELGAFEGQTIDIRFRHGTDSSVNTYYGGAFDDFQIFGTTASLYGSLDGTVTDCDGEVVEDAMVHVVGTNFMAETDAGGYYLIDEVLVGTWDVEVTHDNYWPMTITDVEIAEDVTTTQDFEDLEYPEGEPTATTLEMTVYIGQDDADSTASVDFDLESVGCGPLSWSAALDVIYEPWAEGATASEPGQPLVEGNREFQIMDNNFMSPNPSEGPVRPENEVDELWDVLASFMNLETELGTNGIVGTVLTAEYMYISSFNSGAFYVCDLDGNLLETITLPGNMDGLIDLSYYDGYLYGVAYFGDQGLYRWEHNDIAGAENLYTTPAAQGIGCAYDWDTEWFYFSEWSSIGRWNEGTGVAEVVTVPAGVSDIMGMSYCPADPDGYTLWIFTQQNAGAIMYRTNPETGEASTGITLQAAILSGGFNIGDEYDSSNWSIQCSFQGTPDYVEVYEGYPAAPDWLTMDPMEGELEPSESANIIVTADIRGELYPADAPGDIEHEMTAEAEIEFGGPYWQGTVVTLAVTFINAAPESESNLPTAYALHQNFPNPFNPSTNLRFDLVDAQNVRLMVYNILGQEVARLVDGRMEAGFHEVVFDASMLSSGVYFYRIETDAFTSMKKMVLVK